MANLKRLHSLRKRKNITLRQLSKDLQTKFGLKIQESGLSKYEHGDRQPSFETTENIASYFGVSPAYLIGWSDERDVDNEE